MMSDLRTVIRAAVADALTWGDDIPTTTWKILSAISDNCSADVRQGAMDALFGDRELPKTDKDVYGERDGYAISVPQLERTLVAFAQATLRASGRLGPAVGGDVVEQAAEELWHAERGDGKRRSIDWSEVLEEDRDRYRRKISAVTPIIAAATEARVREECAKAISAVEPGSQIGPLYGAGISAGLKAAEDIVMNGATR